MPRARKDLIDLNATPYYHVYSRCVRRAFLCGKDDVTGRDYSHRRDLVEGRLTTMASVFTIDLCAYALMENHAHFVLSVDKPKADALTDRDVVTRWGRIFSIPEYVSAFLDTGHIGGNDPVGWIAERRNRIADISWFMRVVKEYIARIANKEDQCTGAFWEKRFHSHALTDHKALLTAMAYVDLNPVRARICETPEESDHTSVQLRCQEAASGAPPRVPLKPFHDQENAPHALPMRRDDYLSLVDWTGRSLRQGKGSIPAHIPPILDRIGHDQRSWFLAIRLLRTHRYAIIGPTDDLRRWAQRAGQKFVNGVRMYREAFGICGI